MKLITRAAACNIKTFMACKFDDDFSGLIIEGEPDEADLWSAWEKITVEYLDISGVEIPELEKRNRMHEIDLSIKVCNLCFIGLENALSYELMDEMGDEFISLLKQNGVSLRWKGDTNDFKKQMQSAQVQYKIKYVRLEELTKELEQVQADATKPETASDFYRLINNIETLMNIRISETEMHMARFGVLVNDYRSLLSKQSPS